jgi:hypothetical protein
MKKATSQGRFFFEASRALSLLHKLRLELHRAKAVNLAVDVMVAIDQADVFDLGTDLDDRGRAFDLQVFHQSHGVTVLQHVAVGVFPDTLGGFGGSAVGGVPFMGAHGADQKAAVFVGQVRAALGAVGEGAHGLALLVVGQAQEVVAFAQLQQTTL